VVAVPSRLCVHTGDVVKVVTYSGFVAHGVTALRHCG